MLALVGFPLLFLALLLRVYPATSVDLYDYLFRGRMLARYQANTFVQVPQDYVLDPLFDYAAWRRAVTAVDLRACISFASHTGNLRRSRTVRQRHGHALQPI